MQTHIYTYNTHTDTHAITLWLFEYNFWVFFFWVCSHIWCYSVIYCGMINLSLATNSMWGDSVLQQPPTANSFSVSGEPSESLVPFCWSLKLAPFWVNLVYIYLISKWGFIRLLHKSLFSLTHPYPSFSPPLPPSLYKILDTGIYHFHIVHILQSFPPKMNAMSSEHFCAFISWV